MDDVVAPLNDSSVTITSAASHGTTHLESNGDILYTPATGYTGPDSFVYTVADTSGKVSNPATVSINVENAPHRWQARTRSPPSPMTRLR